MTFWGSQASKNREIRSVTELSFESGAHFKRGGANVHREPKKAPIRPKAGFWEPRGAQSRAKRGPREAQDGPKEPKGTPREVQGAPKGPLWSGS